MMDARPKYVLRQESNSTRSWKRGDSRWVLRDALSWQVQDHFTTEADARMHALLHDMDIAGTLPHAVVEW